MLSPSLAPWITATFDGVDAQSAYWIGLVDAPDSQILLAALEVGAVVLTKDGVFASQIQSREGVAVIWLCTGNGSTRAVKPVLEVHLPAALAAIRRGNALVEIPPPE